LIILFNIKLLFIYLNFSFFCSFFRINDYETLKTNCLIEPYTKKSYEKRNSVFIENLNLLNKCQARLCKAK